MNERVQYKLNGETAKNLHFHLVKQINMNISQVKNMLPPEQCKITKQLKCNYSPLEKTIKKQNKNYQRAARKTS